MSRRDFIKFIIAFLVVSGMGGIAYRLVRKAPEFTDSKSITYKEDTLESIVSFKYIADNLKIPWSVVPIDERRYIVSERPGNILAILGDKRKLIASFNVASIGEAGLLGLALHPDFPNKPYLYAYLSYYSNSNTISNRIVRIKINPSTLEADTWSTIVDGIPGSRIHNGGRIKFGPDGRLYITTGDAAKPELPQKLDNLAGKILRVEDDGSIPEDNPFEKSLIYSYGHRNPQGIDWHPSKQFMVSSEHGPVGHDEINIIYPGRNYGWPHVKGIAGKTEYVDPILESGPDTTWAPSGISFIRDRMFSKFTGDLLVACLRGQRLLRIRIRDENTAYIDEELFINRFGRIRDVTIDHDGAILLLTSNTDGRGRPRAGDDKLIKLYLI